MSVHFYQDDCGSVGERRRDTSRQEAREAADAEGFAAYAEVEHLAGVLDRHEGDYGEDAEALASITRRIVALREEVVALLGNPARGIWQNGRIVALVMEPRS